MTQNFPQFIVIHTVKGFVIVNKAEIDGFFLELSCFFDDPADVGNLISGSSAISKTSLNIWKFTVHILLKPGLENYEHYFTSVWNECNCAVVWAFFWIAFLRDLCLCVCVCVSSNHYEQYLKANSSKYKIFLNNFKVLLQIL